MSKSTPPERLMGMMTSMRLYELAPTRSIRVRWTLQELGVDFEAVTIDLQKGDNRTPDFRALNPAGKLPVLVDGDAVLTESVAIVLYLADKYPEHRLLPTEVAARGQAYRWMLFTATELEQPLWRITRNVLVYPEAERQPSDVAIARREFGEMAAVLARHMEGREYVVGDRVSVVDFVTAYTLYWANEEELLGDQPVLRSYMERMYARPKAAMRIAKAFASISGNAGGG
jgi:glutathione S-transferase